MHRCRVVAVTGDEGKQWEQENIVQHEDAGEVRLKPAGHDDGANLVIHERQIGQQRVIELTDLLCLQGGDEFAHTGQPSSSIASA